VPDPYNDFFEVRGQFDENRFIFHANAVAAAGQFNRIGEQNVNLISPSQGQTSLPVIGGISRSSVDGSLARYAQFFQYGLSETFAEGKLTEEGTKAEVTLRASVSNLRVINRPSKDERPGVISVEFQGDKVAVTVKSVYPQKSEPVFQLQDITTDQMWVVVETEQETRRIPIRLVLDVRPFEMPYSDGGLDVQSIVKQIVRGDCTTDGHVLVEKGLGRIHFGEVLIAEDSRRLTMVRIELGSLIKGSVSFSEVNPNGVWPVGS
jgi:hypothetical protein